MFGFLHCAPNYLNGLGLALRHCQLLLLSVYNCLAVMFLRRSESLKWIRRRFTRNRGSNCQADTPPDCTNDENLPNATPALTTTTTEEWHVNIKGDRAAQIENAAQDDDDADDAERPRTKQQNVLACGSESMLDDNVDTTTTTKTTTNECNSSESLLHEVVVVAAVPNDTKIVANRTALTIGNTDMASAQNEAAIEGGRTATATAPIACEEEEEDDEDDDEENALRQLNGDCDVDVDGDGDVVTATEGSADDAAMPVQRSKSRVRTYLKKCKERLTGQQNQQTAPNHQNQQTDIAETHQSWRSVREMGDDMDFGTRNEPVVSTGTNTQQQQQQQLIRDPHDGENIASKCAGGVATLIDSYLGHTYPVYWQATRAILLRQARDLLVGSYSGSMQMFETKFLCKFAQIASDLRERHRIGENLVWSRGWPLATPIGELILHMGGLDDDAQLKDGDIYLCIKTTPAEQEPKLYAVWRNSTVHANPTTTTATVHECCLQLDDNFENCAWYRGRRDCNYYHLSPLTIETMLSDELPQLLQHLLVGVERTIGRISLNELKMPNDGVDSTSLSYGTDDANNNNHNNTTTNVGHNNVTPPTVTNSPKCVLRRSELITKHNKLLNGNKLMLRRLTTRQDSMHSTSSGNSCTSASSTASSNTNELMANYIGHNSNSNNSSNSNNNNHTNGNGLNVSGGAATSSSSSPALPLFCLGSSFPHIDSDEENGDDKRQSIESDDFAMEISAPTSILDIPEKLLMSGIQLPGTRDLKGHPLIIVEAASVLQAGLNCFEIATVLLYYSTIPERHERQESKPSTPQPQSEQPTTMTMTTPPPPPLKLHQEQTAGAPATLSSFAILIAIENSHHLCVIDLICQSLKLLGKRIGHCEMQAVWLDGVGDGDGVAAANKQHNQNTNNNNNNDNTNALAATAINCHHSSDKEQPQPQPQPQQYTLKFISVDEVTTSVAPLLQLPCGKLHGLHHHDPRKWREFFMQLEPLQRQCATAGQRLCAAMSDIRSSDLQGLPTRRQLYAQHRALSRALMDSELHNLRKRGAGQLQRLHEMAKLAQEHSSGCLTSTTTTNNNNNNNKNCGGGYISSHRNVSIKSNLMTSSAAAAAAAVAVGAITDNEPNAVASTAVMRNILLPHSNHSSNNNNNNNNTDIAIRLHKVTLLFNEVDRAAKRLEQLTEQRRERLRQRALEDEINEVTSWISSDGTETLQRYANVQLDCEHSVKEHEPEFEKYYFISMKHLAKGRDLHEAAAKIDTLRESASNLKTALDSFAEKLETARERIEGASRLHHLLDGGLYGREASVQQEIERLAEQLGVNTAMLDKYRPNKEPVKHRFKPTPLSLNLGGETKSHQKPAAFAASTPQGRSHRLSNRASSGNSSLFESSASAAGGAKHGVCHCWHEHDGDGDGREDDDDDDDDDGDDEEDDDERPEEDEEEDCEEQQSKIADSGLGVGCEHCEGNLKMTRICSCQSLNEAANMYGKGDELDDECYERPSKRYQDIHSPMEANAHLQCHASSLELPSQLDELSCLEPKIQKTLLLIIREMIGTERDYVRSLYYVIENYVDELLRDDIPQPLRGQRNVIFGNIEKIFEFHNSHFLSELERYERHPLKVGAAFLHMESKFYLYALYNKNKPKSDTLMSEYGTAFFKSKQLELNDKMDLASYLLKPVQRMGKYALLLQQLVKACNSVQGGALQEIATDVEELQRAEEMVKFQLRHGNDLLAMDSLRDCDVNVKEQGRLLRQNEFLVWQGRGGKKSLRQIFLFEELVLFSKARRFPDHKNLDIYIYKNSIKTSDIGLTAHVGDSPTKFEIWFRKRKPEDTWTMQCMSEDIKNAWTEEISKLLWKQAKRNREIRLAEMSSMGIGSKPCLDIRPSNNQINDRSITITQLGKTPKLRHSFVGQPSDPAKSSRRPNSLISESSISSGTSSSSLSTGSSSGHERLACLTSGAVSTSGGRSTAVHALELINETQTLTLDVDKAPHAATTTHVRNHKRSTTIVSQLSMESGILSDMSMPPEQEHQSLPMNSSVCPAGRRHKTGTLQRSAETSCSAKSLEYRVDHNNSVDHSNPYLQDKREETVINL